MNTNTCTWYIVSGIAIPEKVFNNRKHLLRAKKLKRVRKRLIKMYIWSIETRYAWRIRRITKRNRTVWTIWDVGTREELRESFERIKIEVFKIVLEKKSLLKSTKMRKKLMLCSIRISKLECWTEMVGRLLQQQELIFLNKKKKEEIIYDFLWLALTW